MDGSSSEVGKLALCAHCGGGIPPARHGEGLSHCCEGCAIVASYLKENGLAGYYQRLEAIGAKPGCVKNSDPAAGAPAFVTGMDRLSFVIPALHCAACLWLVREAMARLPFVASVSLRLDLRRLELRVDDPAGRAESVIAVLRGIGFAPLPPGPEGTVAEDRRELARIGLAGAVFGNVMLLAAASYFGDLWGMEAPFERFFAWLSGLATIPCLAFAARPFYSAAATAIAARKLHIDLPITVALGLAAIVSYVSLFRGTGPVYFDSVTGLVFLLLAARALSARLYRSALRSTSERPSLLPARADAVKENEVIDISAGEILPADGVVITGESEISDAAFSGEWIPRARRAGDPVLAGSVNLSSSLRIKVLRTRDQTALSCLRQRLADAATAPSRFELAAERILPYFTGVTILIALGVGCYWHWRDPSRALEVVLTLLIVSCPCALALATPLLSAFSMRRARAQGAHLRGVDVLERMAVVDCVVLDKTGTLSEGRPKVIRTHLVNGLPSAAFQALSRIVGVSRHPLSRAVQEWLAHEHAAGSPPQDEEGTELREIAGKGTELRFPSGERWRLGSLDWHAESGEPNDHGELERLLPQGASGMSAVLWNPGKEGALLFLFDDPLRTEIAESVTALTQAGVEVWIASGDRDAEVHRVARSAGIALARALGRRSPEDKLALVRQLEERGKRVLVFGDGVNDALALRAGTAAVATRAAVDLAVLSSGAVLERDDVRLLPAVLGFARYSRSSLRLILGASIAYNSVAIAIAAGGHLHPLVAALIMPLSSVTGLTIALLRKGTKLWPSSTGSCPLPSPSLAPPSGPFSGPPGTANSTTAKLPVTSF